MTRRRAHPLAEELLAIGRGGASLPVLDDRTLDDIIGFDESGFPG